MFFSYALVCFIIAFTLKAHVLQLIHPNIDGCSFAHGFLSISCYFSYNRSSFFSLNFIIAPNLIYFINIPFFLIRQLHICNSACKCLFVSSFHISKSSYFLNNPSKQHRVNSYLPLLLAPLLHYWGVKAFLIALSTFAFAIFDTRQKIVLYTVRLVFSLRPI